MGRKTATSGSTQGKKRVPVKWLMDQLKLTFNDIREFLEKRGIPVRSPSSKVDPEIAQDVLEHFKADAQLRKLLEEVFWPQKKARTSGATAPEASATAPAKKTKGKKKEAGTPTPSDSSESSGVRSQVSTPSPAAELSVQIVGKVDLEGKKGVGARKKEVSPPEKEEEGTGVQVQASPATEAKDVQPEKEDSTAHTPAKAEATDGVGEKTTESPSGSSGLEAGGLTTGSSAVLEGPQVVGRLDPAKLEGSSVFLKKSREARKDKGKDKEKGRSKGRALAAKGVPAQSSVAPSPDQDKGREWAKEKDRSRSKPEVTIGKEDKRGVGIVGVRESAAEESSVVPPVRRVVVHPRQVRTYSTAKRKARKKEEKPTPEKKKKDTPTLVPTVFTLGKVKKKKERKRKRRQEGVLTEEKKVLEVSEFLTTAELASLMNVSPQQIIGMCMELGNMVTLNQRLDKELIELIAGELGYEVRFVDVKEQMIEEEEEEPKEWRVRPPVVVVMGHVDHGKTRLLDYIRKTNVVAGEAGGITQHIGAYQVTLDNNQKITFLDTPGHEAFTSMRARGAKIADIAIIVIAANEGVMPQTREAISHAQSAGLDIIFAINKIDLPDANPQRVYQQLAELGFLVEEWGGEYLAQEISALKGIGVPELLEKILLLAELKELKAPIDVRPKGYVIEAQQISGLGNAATLLVMEGVLKKGMPLVAGHAFCRVRAMLDERGKPVEEAPPGTPVRVTGFEVLPEAGDRFVVYKDESLARKVAQYRERILREQQYRVRRARFADLHKQVEKGEVAELNLIIRADTYGTLEAVRDALSRLSVEDVTVRIIYADIGQISESDIVLAAATQAIVIGFHVRPHPKARTRAEQEGVEIRTYSVIYKLIEDIQAAVEGLRKPVEKEVILGTAEVKAIFRIRGVGTVAGCLVRQGVIRRGARVHVIRDGVVVYTGTIDSLKRFKDDVKEVAEGYECGVHIAGFDDVKPGDMLECFEIQLVKPSEAAAPAAAESAGASSRRG